MENSGRLLEWIPQCAIQGVRQAPDNFHNPIQPLALHPRITTTPPIWRRIQSQDTPEADSHHSQEKSVNEPKPRNRKLPLTLRWLLRHNAPGLLDYTVTLE
ncbi:hypothetical protein PoB_006688000 [Plakobranchus ocellatus]|uniref:Uncharacterized protein n=1 Tax=Plakobranchus ocellatus TaxID=259542 RepID=A0AAV4D8C9_9GAST|nr:hypothetical protein PoB_006688000 [Plakobranchus ocellatus]